MGGMTQLWSRRQGENHSYDVSTKSDPDDRGNDVMAKQNQSESERWIERSNAVFDKRPGGLFLVKSLKYWYNETELTVDNIPSMVKEQSTVAEWKHCAVRK